MSDQLYEVKISSKCTIFLTHTEMLQLLKYDSDIYATAIKRGKGILRHQQQRQRERQKYEEHQKKENFGSH